MTMFLKRRRELLQLIGDLREELRITRSASASLLAVEEKTHVVMQAQLKALHALADAYLANARTLARLEHRLDGMSEGRAPPPWLSRRPPDPSRN